MISTPYAFNISTVASAPVSMPLRSSAGLLMLMLHPAFYLVGERVLSFMIFIALCDRIMIVVSNTTLFKRFPLGRRLVFLHSPFFWLSGRMKRKFFRA